MKWYKKAIICIMIVSVLFGLPACQKNDNAVGNEKKEPVQIQISDLSSYKFVRAEKASSDLTSAIAGFMKDVRAIIPGDYELKTDYYKEDSDLFTIDECEILLGQTNREESTGFISGLKNKDYGWALYGKKLVIAGADDNLTVKALEAFVNDMLSGITTESTVFFSEESNYVMQAEYTVDTLNFRFGDSVVPIKSYTIVYGKVGDTSLGGVAEILKSKISEKTGFILPVTAVEKLESGVKNCIVIGECAGFETGASCSDAEYSVSVRGTDIIITGNNAYAMAAGTSDFIESIIYGGEKNIEATPESGNYDYSFDIMTAMSFNVLVSSVTTERQNAVVGMVKSYMPDTIGFQEVDSSWLGTLRSGLGKDYYYVGEARNGGSDGEYNPIFYKKGVFNVLSSGTQWLSDTPNRVSKYDVAMYNRILTYALLERIDNGQKTMVVNTHLDHKSADAREKQAKVLVAFLKSVSEYPVILTGDFNTNSDSTAYKTIINGGFADSAFCAAEAHRASTFTNFGASNKTLDFAFVNQNLITVLRYKVCNEKIKNVMPSDHHPVLIEYIVN